MNTVIDLRSDTVTLPTNAMLDAMRVASMGDDSLDGDPTVRRLEALGAALTGKDDAIFLVSGTMGNVVASLVHARRGAEALVDDGAHIARSETGGLTRLAGLVCTRLPSSHGEIDLNILEDSLRRGYSKYGEPTAMVVIESSHNHAGGRVPSLEYMQIVQSMADAKGVAVHLDGARLFNAALALGVDVVRLAATADSVTFCLSKGLSAPMGSLLVGSREFIDKARTFRRMVGGGLRQAGGIAAAGIVALEQMTQRLVDDHRRAHMLWKLLSKDAPSMVDEDVPQTNIVLAHRSDKCGFSDAESWAAYLHDKGLLVRARDMDTLRIVTHRHISDEEIVRAVELILDSREMCR